MAVRYNCDIYELCKDAIKEKDYEKLITIFDTRYDMNTKDPNDEPFLHYCLRRCNDLDLIKFLIERGSVVDSTDDDGATPLMLSIRWRGDLSFVALFLMSGACPNMKDRYGNTPLHYCSTYCRDGSRYAIANLLIDHKADVNANSIAKGLVLHSFIQAKSEVSLLRLLIDSGADVHKRCYSKYTVLHLCSCYEDETTGCEVIRYLVEEHGADVNALACSNDVTPLLYFAEKGCKVKMVELLLEYGANPHYSAHDGRTVLHRCHAYNFVNFKEVFKVLMKYKVDINATDCHGHTPLTSFIKNCCEASTMAFLLEVGADLNKNLNFIEREALHVCLSWAMTIALHEDDDERERSDYRLSELIEILIMYGADIFAMNAICESLLDVLCVYSNEGLFFSHTGYILFKYSLLKEENTWKRLKGELVPGLTTFSEYFEQRNFASLQTKLFACLAELPQLKTFHIKNRISLHTFCTETDRLKLGRYFKNCNLSDVGVPLLKNLFPHYFDLINLKMNIGKRWSAVLHELESVCFISRTEYTKVVLDRYCTKEIVSYLNEEDLLNLVAALEQ